MITRRSLLTALGALLLPWRAKAAPIVQTVSWLPPGTVVMLTEPEFVGSLPDFYQVPKSVRELGTERLLATFNQEPHRTLISAYLGTPEGRGKIMTTLVRGLNLAHAGRIQAMDHARRDTPGFRRKTAKLWVDRIEAMQDIMNGEEDYDRARIENLLGELLDWSVLP